MQKLENWKLIQRYITGNATPEERRKLWKWMDQNPENRDLVRQLEEIWEQTPEEDFRVDVEDAWKKFNQDHFSQHEVSQVTNKKSHPSKRLIYLVRAAAVILLILFAGYFTNTYLADLAFQEEQAKEFYVMQDLQTDKGEKASVTFSDGTEVMLNAASSLRFPKKFNGAREVYLDGEAYFKVTHNSENPFIIHTEHADIQVIGTEFNVQGWNEDTNVDVAVREGKVSVQPVGKSQNPDEVILTQGEYTRVEQNYGPAPVQQVNIENHLLWTQGGLHFDNVPLSQVFRHLERKFDVQIDVADNEALSVPFTSTFREAQLNEILRVIAASMEMDYTRDGNSVEFEKSKVE